VAIEFAPYTQLDGITEATELAHTARSEATTGILVDTWHFFHGKNDWDDLDALHLEDLALVQMSDGPAVLADRRDGMGRRSIPGDGELDLTQFADRIRDKGWDGEVVLEVLSDADRELPVAEFARRCREATLPYWS